MVHEEQGGVRSESGVQESGGKNRKSVKEDIGSGWRRGEDP